MLAGVEGNVLALLQALIANQSGLGPRSASDAGMELDTGAFHNARLERNAYLATACFITYEYLLQISNEVELFWKKRWTFGKCLFLWSRYYSLAFNVSNAFAFLDANPTLDVSTRFFHWQNTGAAFQVITTHLILELRIYAMYGSTRLMLGVCLCLAVMEAIVFGILFGIQNPDLVGTNNPSPGLFLCADGDPPHGHWITYYWMSILIIESILLGLSVYKGWQTHQSGLGGGLMGVLTRDSIFYYLVIFLVYGMNMIFWFLNILTLDEFGTGFAFTISSVLANRLLISVRERYYMARSELEDFNTFTSMHFQSAPGERADTIALGTLQDQSEGGQTRWEELTTCYRVDDGEGHNYSEARGF
ncbi:hypothetical protein BDW22DRAFT_1485579 [Trametopsis cervina]|nr:hypothetical protein BDW22DRAFT_1485579 [Trametopsis cervina]